MINCLRVLSTFIKRKVNKSEYISHPCATCLEATTASGLCSGCAADMPRNIDSCDRCALPLSLPENAFPLCGPCIADPPAFDLVVAPWLYAFPVNSLIGRFKYSRQRAYGHPLAQMLAESIAMRSEPPPTCLIPVPMHRHRQQARGFNQAEEIALWVSDRLDIPVNRKVLQRKNKQDAQSGLTRRQRLNNLKGAFRANGPVPAHVAVIDDVMTTGATAQEIARVLRRHGAETVEVWALARTPRMP